MNTNDCLMDVHKALVAKAKECCAASGNNKLALEISGEVADYGAYWAKAFGNDGKIDNDEENELNRKFATIVYGRLPSRDDDLVEKAWNGVKYFGITFFKGVKNYLNEWFGLGLK